MYYLLFYEKAPDYPERQKAHAEAHLAYLTQCTASGVLLLGGSLEDPVDGAALLLCRADSPEAVDALAEGDPYVKEGVVTNWWVRKWDLVVGKSLPQL
jgi:uncharacterized protein YciI